jgi:hypothetical protein
MILTYLASGCTYRCQRVAAFLRIIRHSAPVAAWIVISPVRKTGIIFLTFTA